MHSRTLLTLSLVSLFAIPSQATEKPTYFEVNEGQAPEGVDFVGQGAKARYSISSGGFVARLPNDGAAHMVTFVGADPSSAGLGIVPLPGRSNYFKGSDPSCWTVEIPHFARLRYDDVYPGIDVDYYFTEGDIEFDLTLAPGADPSRMLLRLEGAGATTLTEEGVLVENDGASIMLRSPRIHQTVDGRKQSIGGHYVLGVNGELTITLDAYDCAAPLVVDPVFVTSSYFGGSGAEFGGGIAVDATGNTYLVGDTASTDLPMLQPVQGTPGGLDDIFVCELSPTGTLLFSTYLGGFGIERDAKCAVDATGAIYLTGQTYSPNFPTVNPLQQSGDMFVTKLAPGGASIVWSTYFGGDLMDRPYGIAVGPSGRACVVGETSSSDFPLVNPVQPSLGGAQSAFVTRFGAAGDRLDFSSFLGGTDYDYAYDVAIDAQDAVYVAGTTLSDDFPVLNAIQPTMPVSNTSDCFVWKMAANGSVVFSTYVGGLRDDSCHGISVSGNGSMVAVVGWTQSIDFPVSRPIQGTLKGTQDAVAFALTATGNAYQFSSYFGGSGEDRAEDVGLDSAGNMAIFGHTNSTDLPLMSPVQAVYGGGVYDCFVARLSPAAAVVSYATYLGGSDMEFPYGLAVRNNDHIHVTGYTVSQDFPVVAPFQGQYGGGVSDVFYTVIAQSCGVISVGPPSLPGGSLGMTYSASLTASGGSAPYVFSISSGALPPGLSLSASGAVSGTPASTGSYGITAVAVDAGGCYSSRAFTIAISGSAGDNVVAAMGLGLPNPNRVRVARQDGTFTTTDFLAYGAGKWGVNASVGHIDGGAKPSILTGPGPGDVFGPQVRAFTYLGNGIGKVNFYAYGTLKYGVNVDAGDVEGDGFAEVVTGAGPGSSFGPHVRGWNYDGSSVAPIAKINFFAYATPRFGVNVTHGNLDGDASVEMLTGPGPGAIFGPQARGWNYDGAVVTSIAKINFNAFPTQGYGLNVSAGNVDGDLFDEILCALGPGPFHCSRFLGFDYDGNAVAATAGFNVVAFLTAYGGRVGSGDLTGGGREQLLAGPGRDPAASSRMAPFLYAGSALTPLLSYDAFPGAAFGVSVTSGALGL